MSRVMLKAEEHNWGLSGPGSWEKAEWEVWDDGTFFFSESFRSFDDTQPGFPIRGMMNPAPFAELSRAMCDQWSDETVNAWDGTAWEFRAYGLDASVVKHRPLGYIYGIEPFEKIAGILSGLVRPIDDDPDSWLDDL